MTVAPAAWIALTLLGWTPPVVSPPRPSLKKELKRLGVPLAIVLASDGDGFPAWSPDSRYVTAPVAGEWKKIDLAHIRLRKVAGGAGPAIGAVRSSRSITALDSK